MIHWKTVLVYSSGFEGIVQNEYWQGFALVGAISFCIFSFHIVYMLWFVQLCKSFVEKKGVWTPCFKIIPFYFLKSPIPTPRHLTSKLVIHNVGFSSSLFSTSYVMFLLIKYMAILGNVYISLYCREAGNVFCHPFNFFFFSVWTYNTFTY